jgi:hypothetical protein
MDNSDFALFDSFLKEEKSEEGVYARFFDKWVKTGKIKENGMPEYVSRLYIEIKLKNNPDTVKRPAEENDMMRFSREYAAYRNKAQKIAQGTPLTQFAFLDAMQIEVCDKRGIYTVEALAALTDEQAQSINIKAEKDMAIKFLEMAKNNAAIARYVEENEQLKEKIAELEEENKALKEALKAPAA